MERKGQHIRERRGFCDTWKNVVERVAPPGISEHITTNNALSVNASEHVSSLPAIYKGSRHSVSSSINKASHTILDSAAHNGLLLLATSSGLSGRRLDVGTSPSHPQLQSEVVTGQC